MGSVKMKVNLACEDLSLRYVGCTLTKKPVIYVEVCEKEKLLDLMLQNNVQVINGKRTVNVDVMKPPLNY